MQFCEKIEFENLRVGLQMRRALPALIRDREVDLHLRRGPFFSFRMRR